METPGEFLKRKREEQEASLEDIAARTNLRPEVVRNLEADLFNFAPAPVYVVGALTAYAKALGIDEQEVLELYHEMISPSETEIVTEPEPPRSRFTLPLGWKGIAGIAAGIIVIAVLIIFGRRVSTTRPDEGTPSPTVYEPPAETLVVETPAPMEPATRVVLEMSVEESTWVALEMDGGVDRYSALLSPGTYRRWEADSTFSIKIGNAGGVTLLLDGEPVDFPHRRGRVVMLDLPE
jgi:cytoskeletal protein RodZ